MRHAIYPRMSVTKIEPLFNPAMWTHFQLPLIGVLALWLNVHGWLRHLSNSDRAHTGKCGGPNSNFRTWNMHTDLKARIHAKANAHRRPVKDELKPQQSAILRHLNVCSLEQRWQRQTGGCTTRTVSWCCLDNIRLYGLFDHADETAIRGNLVELAAAFAPGRVRIYPTELKPLSETLCG